MGIRYRVVGCFYPNTLYLLPGTRRLGQNHYHFMNKSLPNLLLIDFLKTIPIEPTHAAIPHAGKNVAVLIAVDSMHLQAG